MFDSFEVLIKISKEVYNIVQLLSIFIFNTSVNNCSIQMLNCVTNRDKFKLQNHQGNYDKRTI